MELLLHTYLFIYLFTNLLYLFIYLFISIFFKSNDKLNKCKEKMLTRYTITFKHDSKDKLFHLIFS